MSAAAAPTTLAPASVTLLFTDLAGSTELMGRIGDDAAQQLLRDHFSTLRQATSEHGGEEVKSLGDGLMLAFPDPGRALACAVEMQRAIDRQNRSRPDRALGLRVGINSGETIREGDDYFGMTVVVAKRLCDRAAPGQILLSEWCRRNCGQADGVPVQPMGALSLKGIADPIKAWEIAWHEEAASTPRADAEPEPEPEGPPLPPVVDAIAEGRFVGRADALARLEADLQRARAGERRMVTLAGEPGIGKTRLAAELATRAHRQDCLVLYGRCDEEPLAPYQPFVEALGQLAAQLPREELLDAAGDGAASLGRLVPQLQVPEPQAASPADAETERYRLFQAVAGVLDRAARSAPVLLLLDDVHWADKPTLLLLRHLMRSPGRCPLLVIATYRDSEVTSAHPLSDTVADLRRARVVERIRLDGLTETEVGDLFAAWAGHPAPAGLASALWRETEGHAFFVEESLRHLLETGAIYERRGRLNTDRAVRDIPESVRDVIESRLARLDPPVREVLGAASVVGREFSVGMVEQVGGMPIDALLTALDDATAARVVEPSAGAYDCYTFTHALVREVLYEDIPPPRRARLHQRAGETLETGPEREARVADLAHHYFRAGGGEAFAKAIEYSIQAGARATDQLAYEEAAGHYERALEGLARQPAGESRGCDVLLALGDSRWKSGEFAGARDAYLQAAELADRLGLVTEHAAAALGFGGRVGYRTGVVDDQLVSLLERSLELLGDQDTPLKAMVLAQLAEALASSASVERREELCRSAEEIARATGDKTALAFVLQRSIWALWTPENVQQRLATAAEVVDLVAELGDTTTAIEARLTLLASQLELGLAVEGLDDYLAELVSDVAATRQPYSEWLLNSVRATRALYDRPVDEAERLAWQALNAIDASQHPAAVELFGTQMMYIRYLQGRTAEMHASLQAYIELFPGVGTFRASLALVYAEMGLVEEARRELEAVAADDFAAIGRDMLWFTAMNTLSVVCTVLGDQEHAARLYDFLTPHADGYCALGAMGVPSCSFQRHLGMLSTTCGRYDEAAAHFESALGRNEAIGSNLSLTLTKLEFARALVARDAEGDRERALDLLSQASDEAEQTGMVRVAQKARALLSEANGAAGARPASASGAAALVKRAVRAGSDAKALFSTGARVVIGRRFGDAPAADLERLFGSPVAQRTLFTAMTTSFQPRMAFGFQGEIQLELLHPAGDQQQPPDWWTLEVKERRASAQRRVADDPVVTLHVELPTFIRLFGGELNPLGAWLDGLLRVEGDVLFAPRLIELFGGVKPFEDLASLALRDDEMALAA